MSTPAWVGLHPKITAEHLGFLPSFLDDEDPRPAKEQFNTKYIGGWRPMMGFTLGPNMSLNFSGDQPTYPIAMTSLRDELIFLYPSDWVVIVQTDGTFEVSRMD